MRNSRGTPLAGLLLLVGAGALASGMASSVVDTWRETPVGAIGFGSPTRPWVNSEVAGFAVAFSTLIGLGCGIALAALRRIGFFRLLTVALVGAWVGMMAGFQLIAHGNLLMTLIGSFVLIGFGAIIHRTAGPGERGDEELAWLGADEPLEPLPTAGPKVSTPPLGDNAAAS